MATGNTKHHQKWVSLMSAKQKQSQSQRKWKADRFFHFPSQHFFWFTFPLRYFYGNENLQWISENIDSETCDTTTSSDSNSCRCFAFVRIVLVDNASAVWEYKKFLFPHLYSTLFTKLGTKPFHRAAATTTRNYSSGNEISTSREGNLKLRSLLPLMQSRSFVRSMSTRTWQEHLAVRWREFELDYEAENSEDFFLLIFELLTFSTWKQRSRNEFERRWEFKWEKHDNSAEWMEIEDGQIISSPSFPFVFHLKLQCEHWKRIFRFSSSFFWMLRSSLKLFLLVHGNIFHLFFLIFRSRFSFIRLLSSLCKHRVREASSSTIEIFKGQTLCVFSVG